jgi:single-stranded DNA-binding protein
MTKGKCILADGALKQNRWQDKDGNQRQRHVMIVDRMQFLSMPTAPEAPEAKEELPF